MSRYYFNLYNDLVTMDEEGVELEDERAALDWARHEIRFHAGESIKEHSHLVLSHRLVICDDAKSEVATVHFGDVVRVSE
jgi:hypothetical protein